MAGKPLTANEAVALGAVRAGVQVVTGYPGRQSAGCLASLLGMRLPGWHVESSVNEHVALEVAAGAACAGQLAMCILETSGLNAAYDSLCAVARLGTAGGLVIYVVDDLGGRASVVEQDLRGFARVSGLPLLEPESVEGAYRLGQAAFELSEGIGAPVFVRLTGRVAASRAPLEVEESGPRAERQPVPALEVANAARTGAASSLARHRRLRARLQQAGQLVRELELNRLYLAARTAGPPVAPAPWELPPQPDGRPDPDHLPGQGLRELLDQVYEALDPLLSMREKLPGPLEEILCQVEDALREAEQLSVRQVEELLRCAGEKLKQLGELLPQAQPSVRRAQQRLRRLEGLLPDRATPAPEAPAPVPAAAEEVLAQPHPLQRCGLGIIAVGATAAYIEEGIAQVVQLKPTHWPDLCLDDVSVLRLAAVNPFPAVEVQALLRHCDTVVVLEELEPHIERDVYIEAQRIGFEGQIIGKVNGFFARGVEYGVNEVVRGVAAALDLALPALEPAGEAGAARPAVRPLAVCDACPYHAAYSAVSQALQTLRCEPGPVMVTADAGCPVFDENPPFNTARNEVGMGTGVSLAQGYVHGGLKMPVVVTIGDALFFHGGIAGLINAVQRRVPLAMVIVDGRCAALTASQVDGGTPGRWQAPGDAPADLARVVPALGVDHFCVVDPLDLPAATAAIVRALSLPGVRVVLARPRAAAVS